MLLLNYITKKGSYKLKNTHSIKKDVQQEFKSSQVRFNWRTCPVPTSQNLNNYEK